MATYTNIPTFTSGQVLTSAVMNDVKNNLDLTNAQSAYPYRNLIYNGAMQVHQRGTSTASITAAGYYTADRWQVGNTTMGTWTQTVENDAPTGSGLRKSLKMLCTTADASPAAGDRVFINQGLEGFDVQRLAKGTASAASLTLSFWVKSNLTGTFIVSLYDNDNNRHCSKSYTISASATWERKEITFPADTTGAFDNDNAASLVATFMLGAGSNFTSGTLATSWASYTAANDAVGQTNVAAATNNYLQITGVQLEVGSVSSPFEFLPYGDELARCQRYYFRVSGPGLFSDFAAGFATGATTAITVVPHPVTMRAQATTLDTLTLALSDNVTSFSAGTMTISTSTSNTNRTAIDHTASASLTQFRPLRLTASNSTSAYFGIGAEL